MMLQTKNRMNDGKKKGNIILLLTLWSLLLLSPAFTNRAAAAAPALRQTVFVLKKGQQAQAVLTNDTEGIWQSTDKTIAKINKTTGLIKAKNTGTCQVYYLLPDGEKLTATVHVLEKKRKLMFFGHRGDTERYPENSVISFKSAIARGCSGVEFDVWYTDSGDLLVFHDDTLERMCKSPLLIQEVSKENRSRYPLRQTPYGFSHNVLIPTFGEALKAVRAAGGVCLIHLKYDGNFEKEGIQELVRLIRKYHMEQQCVIFCANRKTLRRLKSSGLTLGFISHSVSTKRSKEQIDWCTEHRVSWFFFATAENMNEKIMEYAHEKQMTVGMYKTRSLSNMEMLYRLNADFAMLYYCSLLNYR